MATAPDSPRIAGRRWPILAATLVATVLTAGCGQGGGEAADTSPTAASPDDTSTATTAAAEADLEEPASDVCDIVSDEVVTDVLGIEIVRREPNGQVGSTFGCTKGAGRADEPEDFSYVSASLLEGGAGLVDQLGSVPRSEPVAGLGDSATYAPSLGTLLIADGPDAIQVQVIHGREPGSMVDCTTIANDVLDRRS